MSAKLRKSLLLRIDDELEAQIRAIAEREDRPISWVIRGLLREGISRHEGIAFGKGT